MDVSAKKIAKYGIYVVVVALTSLVAFIGFNNQRGFDGKLSSNEVTDFFVEEAIADNQSSGGDSSSSGDDDGGG